MSSWCGTWAASALGAAPALAADYSNTRALGVEFFTRYAYPAQVAAIILLVASIAAIVLTLRQRVGHKPQDIAKQVAVQGEGPRSNRQNGRREETMITLTYVLALSGILFSIGVAGVFLNRKNIIILLMCIELMLLAVNFNFVAFSRFRGDIAGQIFVFFILTVAAAEAAIGLAILVVLFRERRSIDVEDLDTLQG